MAVFARMLRRSEAARIAPALYVALVDQARRPAFYREGGVPDTVWGRLDMVMLHAFLVLDRLAAEPGRAAADLGQALFDYMFAEIDLALREMGVGDLSVGRKVKAIAQGFYGRAAAYREGLAAMPGDPAPLIAALRRNLFGTGDPEPAQLAAMADYVMRQQAGLHRQPAADVMAGRLRFEPPPRY